MLFYDHYFEAESIILSKVSTNICPLHPSPPLTCREAVPDLQPVVSAEGARWRRGVRLHVEAIKLHHDLCHLGGKDHKGTFQVVGILLREARCLDDSTGSREVSGTFRTCKVRRYR